MVRWIPWAGRSAEATDAARPLTVTEVHQRHADFVWKSLHRLGVRAADREDLLQEVFLVVHQRLHTFRRDEPMTPWLFGICRNVAVAHRRRAYIRRERLHEQVPEATTEHADQAPDEVARVREAKRKLVVILDDMDVDRRVVFVMFEIEEMSLNEIAASLGIPSGTVSSRLHAARKAFEKALARSARGGK
jgi:RNA polymerase sigma-70 factor (ECF subfamily)